MRWLRAIIGFALVQLWSASVVYASEPLNLLADMGAPIGKHFVYLQEGETPLGLADARLAYGAGRFLPVETEMLSFGIGARPVWLAFAADNPTAQALEREVLVEVSWVDQIDLYFMHQGDVTDHQRVGDRLPYAERPIDGRYFTLPHVFKNGETVVLMRVESPDPMVLPIYVATPKQAHDRAVVEAYSYGLVYGTLFALLAYNFILFLSLKRARYAFYSLYLSSFVAMNMAYTGHGYRWLWPESPVWQMWSNPVLMVAYASSALTFAMYFLETGRHFPRLHLAVKFIILAFLGSEAAAIALGSHVGALLVAFVFSLVFSIVMVLMGAVSVRRGITFATYFLLAALATTIGATVTAVTVWGIVPYTVLGYRAVEIGMIVDALLLALALADQFRVNLEQKNQAVAIARVDPLTELNNRRGFYELAAPVWSTGMRHRRSMTVIIFDLDHFKAFNDTHGHSAGDKALVMVAKGLKNVARRGDIVARWGGEEFVLFLPETTQDQAVLVAERLRASIKADGQTLDGMKLPVTASFGVAERTDNIATLDALIDAADLRLYTAKQLGRDRVCTG